MQLDRKATGSVGGEAQRGRVVRRNVAFDVVAVKMNANGLIRRQTHHDSIVLEN
jgi:hypothetical protein